MHGDHDVIVIGGVPTQGSRSSDWNGSAASASLRGVGRAARYLARRLQTATPI